MPYLAFDVQPPRPNALVDGSAYNATKDHLESKAKPTTPRVEEKPMKEHGLPQSEPNNKHVIEEGPKNAYPVVMLDVDTISDATAGRLATSLLGHVLFLKNQVPFPVMQLGRIPGGKVNSRAFKQRTELLSSYDTISSHLDTTFSALSTALARCADSGASSSIGIGAASLKKVLQAHVAILVGPSLGTAKSKVILGIDGLEARVWGVHEDSAAKGTEEDDESDGAEEDEDSEEDEGEGLEYSGEEPEESDEDDGGEEKSEDEEDEEDEGSVDEESAPLPPPPPYISYAEEQRFLQNADRLLSRKLAAADAEGKGITSEMTPTQTHVLIRAPRRFNHPAWIPRQNITAGLDVSLQDFMNNSGLVNADAEASLPSRQNSKKGKVEGVWVTTRDGIHRPVMANVEHAGQGGEDDADEMIWWSWDGKFVGFNDW